MKLQTRLSNTISAVMACIALGLLALWIASMVM
jgi:hypothetical protein